MRFFVARIIFLLMRFRRGTRMRAWAGLAVSVLSVPLACGGKTGNVEPGTGGSSALGGAGGTSGGSAGSRAGSSGASGVSGSFGTAPGGSAGSGDVGGVGGSLGGPSSLGLGCETSADCGAGFGCWRHGDIQGPSGGLCTRECIGPGDRSCEELAPGSHCVTFEPGNFCVPGCVPGPPNLTDFDPAKCWGRHDLACAPVDGGDYACLPTCNWDGNCGNGFGCSGTSGLCREGGSGTVPVGAACASDCGDNACAEFASEGGLRTTMCTKPCTIGTLPSCDWEGPASGPAESFCLFSASVDTVAVGDLGYCGQLCDCNGQCSNPDFVCVDARSPTLTQATGRRGYCHFSTNGDPGIETCP